MTIPKIEDYPLPTADEYAPAKVGWRVEAPKAALLIHDMQDYFLQFYREDSAMVKQVIDNIAALKAWAKKNDVPVYYTAQPAKQDDASRGLLNDMWGPGLPAKPELADVVAELAPDEDDRVLTKWRYSAFFSSDLEVLLAEEGRDQLIICGIYAHIGVLQTAADAFMKNIKPFMVADAVADFSRENHLYALGYMHRNLGVSTTTNETVSVVAPEAKTTEMA